MKFLKRISFTKSRVRWVIALLLTLAMGAMVFVRFFGLNDELEYHGITTLDSISYNEYGGVLLSPPVTPTFSVGYTFTPSAERPYVASVGFDIFAEESSKDVSKRSTYRLILHSEDGVIANEEFDFDAYWAEGDAPHYYTIPVNKELSADKTYTLSMVCTDVVPDSADLWVAVHLSDVDNISAFAVEGAWYAADFMTVSYARNYTAMLGVLFLAYLCAMAVLLISPYQPKRRWQIGLLVPAVSLVCAFFSLYAVEFVNNSYSLFNLTGRVIAVNFLMFAAMAMLLYVCTGSPFFSIGGTSTILLVGTIANYFSLIYRGTPVMPSILAAFGTATTVLGEYDIRLSPLLCFAILFTLFVWCIASCLLGKKITRKWHARIGMRGIALTCGVLLLYWVNTSFGMEFWNIPVGGWDYAESNAANGFTAHFMENINAIYPIRPTGYTAQKAQDIAESYPSAAAEAQQTPNILFIMNESLVDLEQSDALKTSEPILPYIHSLTGQSNTLTGYVQVPVFGGGTGTSEFMALTGASNLYLRSEAPYKNYIVRETPSLVSDLKALGYTTIAAHPLFGLNWNRHTAYPLIGFDKFWYYPDYFSECSLVRIWVSDSGFYTTLEEMLAAEKQPTFLFAVTMQNHGSYGDEYDNLDEPISILQPRGDYPQAEQYINLAHLSDIAFQELTAYYETVDEPTLIVMFGDHFPAVESEFLDTLFPADDPLSQYTTPFVVWANYDLDKENLPADGSLFSVSFLQTVVMQAANLPMTGWQTLLTDLRTEYPIVSSFEVRNAEGETIKNPLSIPLVRSYAYMQYNLITAETHPKDFFSYAN
jgi:hypothetical protein